MSTKIIIVIQLVALFCNRNTQKQQYFSVSAKIMSDRNTGIGYVYRRIKLN